MDPLVTLLLGTLTVVGFIVVLRLNPFFALISGALLVSFCNGVPGEWSDSATVWTVPVERVLSAFGVMAGKIGLLLVMGSIIGRCMSESRAADRIVQRVCRVAGRRRLPLSLMMSGFILSIPVFYDATFYLLLPLAKSVYRMTRQHYILYLLCIGFGATLSHTLVPPTPGPLVVAETLGVPIGGMMFLGVTVGLCTIPFALAIAHLMNRLMPNPVIQADALGQPVLGDKSGAETNIDTARITGGGTEVSFDDFLSGKGEESGAPMPSFTVAILPIVIPAVLIALQSIFSVLEESGRLDVARYGVLCRTIAFLGHSSMALTLGALLSIFTLKRIRRYTLRALETALEPAYMSAGMIILITSAGGAFGAMLRDSGIGPRIQELTSTGSGFSGMSILVLAFLTAALIKTAQGSSTTAMITVSGIFAAMKLGVPELGCHPAYLAIAIGIGSCVTGWMNDSGFCIFSRMSGVSEVTALKTWTVGLTLLGLSGMLVVLVLSQIFPLVGG